MAPREILTSNRGRHCKHPACKRALSIYNHGIYCHAHVVRLLRQPFIIEPDPKLQTS